MHYELAWFPRQSAAPIVLDAAVLSLVVLLTPLLRDDHLECAALSPPLRSVTRAG